MTLQIHNTLTRRLEPFTPIDPGRVRMYVCGITVRAKLLRMWGGIMDMSMDGSPIIVRTDIDGLFFNGGWCYGGFKATPASGWWFAHLLATGTPHETASAYRFDRFRKGLMIDEKGMGAQPNLH